MIVLSASWSRKMPGPVDFSSVQAQASIQLEAGSIAEIPQRAREAFALVEQAVNEQLRQDHVQIAPPSSAPDRAQSEPMLILGSNSGPSAFVPAPSSTRSYQRTGRKVALVTPSQLGLIDRLLVETKTDANAVLQYYQISVLDQISCKDASALIDELKARQNGAART